MTTTTKATHTPGDWNYDESQRYYSHPVIRVNGVIIARIECWAPMTAEEARANARLIAAAPEMHDALRAIVFQALQGKVLERDACIGTAMRLLARIDGTEAI